jgi:hypothetical protein
VQLEVCDMARIAGVTLAGAPVSALAAAPIEVVAWSPRVVAGNLPGDCGAALH